MGLNYFIESNYRTACEMQRGIKKDFKMIEMVKARNPDIDLVRSWMQEYGLFQGIGAPRRKLIIDAYFELVFDKSCSSIGTEGQLIREVFRRFTTHFSNSTPRKLLSATSKLMWCSFPERIAIYDSFVERAMIILQGLTPALAGMPRVGTSPSFSNKEYIDKVVAFYMNYQDMVCRVLRENQGQLDRLRQESQEVYPYDIRIIDKLLWMLGNPNQPIQFGSNSHGD